jgi:16S rRNA (uracil1498-N3)-methyltransferase
VALRRFYFEKQNLGHEATIQISGDLFHHIRDVCRFGVGDLFEILPGDGRALLYKIAEQGKREFRATKQSERQIPPPAKPDIVLALSVPKLPKVDWILEKSVELGVSEVRPFVSDFSFLRKTSEITTARLDRWHKIIEAATQQSGRGELMKIHSAVTLESLFSEFNRTPKAEGLFPYEGEALVHLKDAIRAVQARSPDQIWLFVGSEGGFSKKEVELFGRQGLKPVSMGSQILRVETACLALVSVIKYKSGALC